MKRLILSVIATTAVVCVVVVFLHVGGGNSSTRKMVQQSLGAANPLATAQESPSATSTSKPSVNSPMVNGSHIALKEFSNWAERFLAGDPSASAARGEAFAWKRREAMLDLIETNPEEALAQTVPFGWRDLLPPNITRHFEKRVDGRGSLEVFVATDFERGNVRMSREVQIGDARYRAFVYGRRVTQISQTSIPLHGIVIAGKMALDEDPIRILETAETKALQKERGIQLAEEICGVSNQSATSRNDPVVANVGGEVKFFCGVDHARIVKRQLALAESGNGKNDTKAATLATDNWTHGPKNVLYMRVNFPDDLTEPISEASAYDVMDASSAFYSQGSYDLTSLFPTVTPLMTLPKTKWWYSTAGPGGLIADAREAARRAGYETANYNLDIVAFTSVPEYDFGGLAAVGAKSVWLQSTGVGVTCHELGHNYGLLHANYWDTITNFSIIGPGMHVEYGNVYDTMGSAGAGNQQFNAMHKNILDWIPDIAVHNVTSNGVYRIFCFDAPTRLDGAFYAAKVSKDSQRDYWIEFRQKFANNKWLQYGVMLNWSPWAQSSGGTHMLDTTPGTPTLNESREDAALVIGRTFDDMVSGVHITPLGRGATGTNIWMDVQVNVGNFTTNNNPEMQIEIDPTNAAPNSLVHFHATASDPDGDTLAYAWTFDDLSFSTNNLPWTFKSWSTPGERVVRCAVSDMKGGVASANTVVTVGSATGFRIMGRILDTNGIPVEGVRVDNGATDLASYIGGYTASDGSYVIAGVTSDVSLNAFKYGYFITNLTWQNPITITSSVQNVDFVAMPLTSVKLTVTTNTLPEESNAQQKFILTRTGDLTNELPVYVFLSGSATLSSDYTLVPTLTAGSNMVTFPSGTQSISFTFQSINDSSVEGPETIMLTVVDDPAYVTYPSYVIAPGSQQTVTIVDNDLPSQPTVTVTAVTPTVRENGMDSGTFSISRSGNPQNDLTVFYTVGGTATPGVDYTSMVGAVIIPAGSSKTMVKFQTIDDKNVEPDETVVLSITPNAAYIVSGSAAQVRIMDDDVLTVTIFPTSATAVEPTTSGTFTVKRDGDLTANVTVNYTISGTASNGVDYSTLSGTMVIPAGSPSADIVVNPLDDNLLEGDESVILTVTTNAGYNVGTPGTATLFIRDNEKTTVTITATDDQASEPGDNTGTFRVSRGSVVNGNLTVNLAISGTAINGVDYVPLDNTVVIPDGSSSVSFDLIAFDDLHVEPTEDVRIFVLPSTNYNVGSPNQAIVTIDDDDGNSVPAVGFISATSAWEENKSPGLPVSLSQTSSMPVTVDYRVIGGTATSGADYSLPQGTLTFNPGERAKSIPMAITNDSIAEPNETIRITLFNPINATLDGIKIHTYTIIDDDTSSVSVTATAPGATEAGPSTGNFRISRVGDTNSPQQVNFEVTGTASAPADYAPIGTSAIIPAGAAFVDLPVLPTNDPTVERNETVVVTLLTAPGAKIISPNIATVTITDDDPNALPVVTVTSTNHPAAVEGGTSGELLFARDNTNGALTVFFSISGTAINGVDYVALTNVVTIPDGQSSFAIPVVAIDDALIEGEEKLVASLTVSDTYRIASPSAATVLIQDNDQRVRVDAGDFLAAEPGTDIGEFTFSRFGTTNTPLQVFFTVSGTASNGVDYVAISNSFTIPAGSLTAVLPIVPLDDVLVEGPETVKLALQANAAYSLDQPTNATVTIWDDEPMLTIVATITNIVEGSKPPSAFRIYRTGDPRYDLLAHLAIGGTATYGVDYPPFFTNIYFSCGVMSIDLVVAPTNELAVETMETVTARLLPDPAYTILQPSNAVINIIDAGTNKTPIITVASPTTNTIYLLGAPVGIILDVPVVDDGDTNTLSLVWTNVSGPSFVTFGNTNQSNTTAIFTNVGVYVLRLTADDGQLTNYTEFTVVVGATQALSTNLLHWALDETNGTTVFDSSGAGRNGVLTGAPNWQTNGGVLAGAARFYGTNDYAAQTVGTNFLNGLKEFSISLWIKPGVTNVPMGIFAASDGTNATLSLSTKTAATCGNGTNVIEATLATTRGSVRRISAPNSLTTGWQHLALVWSNGLPPALYINGALDQPLSSFVPLSGALSNCAQFLVGKGSSDSPNSWNGWIDDVRVFPRALPAGEVTALATLPPANYGAVVDAGTNSTIQINVPLTLQGSVTDDGKPVPPGAVSNVWMLISGPAPVTFTNANNLTNTVVFTDPGEYVLRLIGDDGQVKVFEDITNTAILPTQVNVFATDADAAELGPDTGEIMFSRVGDTNFDLTIYVALTGTASNGADVVFIPWTNSVTLPAGVESVSTLVVPYLDHRTEGDEAFTYTIVSNIAYSIGNGQATVTIHDSPYGVWNIAHFTLEELTDPTLSGEEVDFDHDGRVNFAEYAENQEPKIADAVPPLTTTVQFTNGANHITLTYKRRLPPTDVGYDVIVSDDLLTWHSGTNYVQEISAVNDGNGLTETVTAALVAPWPNPAKKQFVTVRVWLLSTGPP